MHNKKWCLNLPCLFITMFLFAVPLIFKFEYLDKKYYNNIWDAKTYHKYYTIWICLYIVTILISSTILFIRGKMFDLYEKQQQLDVHYQMIINYENNNEMPKNEYREVLLLKCFCLYNVVKLLKEEQTINNV